MEAEVLQWTPSLSLPGITAPGLPQIRGQLPPGFSRLPLTAPGLPTASRERQPWKTIGKEHKSLPTPPPGQAPHVSRRGGHVERIRGAINDPESVQHGCFRAEGPAGQHMVWIWLSPSLPANKAEHRERFPRMLNMCAAQASPPVGGARREPAPGPRSPGRVRQPGSPGWCAGIWGGS